MQSKESSDRHAQRKPGAKDQAPTAVGTAPVTPGEPPDGRENGDTSEALPMPHERDQSVGDTAARPRAVIEQARKDIESGQMDTDMRNQPGLDAERRDAAVKTPD